MKEPSRRQAPTIPYGLAVTAACAAIAFAQAPGGRGPAPPRTAKASALYDITGYWVSVVTEDWRYRMITPVKGDYSGVLLNPAARKIADAWDPAKDEAAGEQCRNYGAAALMSVPSRLHITWQDEQTLKIESDAGEQSRILYFDATEHPGGGWQGYSRALWEIEPSGRGVAPVGSLKVITTKMKPGYLRKNGVPYSANTTLTEYFDLAKEPNGDSYLVVTTTVEDPVYLLQPYLTSSHYRKQKDGSGWRPTPCSAR